MVAHVPFVPVVHDAGPVIVAPVVVVEKFTVAPATGVPLFVTVAVTVAGDPASTCCDVAPTATAGPLGVGVGLAAADALGDAEAVGDADALGDVDGLADVDALGAGVGLGAGVALGVTDALDAGVTLGDTLGAWVTLGAGVALGATDTLGAATGWQPAAYG